MEPICKACDSRSARFENKLQSMILGGELKIGRQLPTERELAEAMGVSKGVVHAGITNLARKGFLRIVPRHGVYVADYIKNGTLDVLSAIINFNGGKIDKPLAESIIKTRMAMEGVAVCELAQNHTEWKLARLRAMLANIRTGVDSGKISSSRELAERLQEYYLTKCFMSGNQIIPILVSSSSEISIALTEMWLDSVSWESVLFSLDRTLRYISEGDETKALENMKKSFNQAIDILHMGS